jgi:dynein heavy chain
LTVGVCLEVGLHTHCNLVAKISGDATQEATLREMIEKVRQQWEATEFATKPFKDSRDATVLGAVDDVLQTLEETQLVMQSVMGSPYVTALRSDAEAWHKKLQLFSDVLDEWLACQRSWMYLESIFAAPDLQRQLPAELKMFQSVDVFWKKLMKGVEMDPDAMRNATQPHVLDELRKANQTLALAQKRVEDHLETKRAAFPRFCFVSGAAALMMPLSNTPATSLLSLSLFQLLGFVKEYRSDHRLPARLSPARALSPPHSSPTTSCSRSSRSAAATRRRCSRT